MGVYKNIDKIMEIEANTDDSSLERDRDPIVEYLKEAKKHKMLPFRKAFKPMRDKDKVDAEEDEEEDIAYNLKSFHISK